MLTSWNDIAINFDGDTFARKVELVKQASHGSAVGNDGGFAVEDDIHVDILDACQAVAPAIIRASEMQGGCSSMVERRLPKPQAWVRFPSPAPTLAQPAQIPDGFALRPYEKP